MAHVPLTFWVLPLKPRGCCPNPTLPVAVTMGLACWVLQTWSVMIRSRVRQQRCKYSSSQLLVYMSSPLTNLLLMLWLPHLQTVPMKFPFLAFHPVLVSRYNDDEIRIPCVCVVS
jgi:hypothetical protein